MGDALDRHLALLHRLEQGRLRPWGRPVDLVDEHDVREHRAGDEPELAVRLVVDADPGEVARQEVRRRLDPAEPSRDRDRERSRERRLPDAGHALEQQVPVGEQADRRRLDGVVVPGDDRLDVPDQTAERRGCLVEGPPRLDHRSGFDGSRRGLEECPNALVKRSAGSPSPGRLPRRNPTRR